MPKPHKIDIFNTKKSPHSIFNEKLVAFLRNLFTDWLPIEIEWKWGRVVLLDSIYGTDECVNDVQVNNSAASTGLSVWCMPIQNQVQYNDKLMTFVLNCQPLNENVSLDM